MKRITEFITIKFLIVFICMMSTNGYAQTQREINDSLLHQLLTGSHTDVDRVLANPAYYEFQLIFTQVLRSGDSLIFEERSLNKDSACFYPASLIKFPLAVVALEKLQQLGSLGVQAKSTMSLKTCSCDLPTNQYVQKSKNPTFLQFLREMLIMSDNDAYNLFFDFVGTDQFNQRMRDYGLNGIIMRRRFTSGCPDSINKINGGLRFYNQKREILWSQPCDSAKQTYELESHYRTSAGRFHYQNGKKIQEPKSYKNTNFVRLADAHTLLIRLFFPSLTPVGVQQPSLDSNHKAMLIEAMGAFPKELKNAPKDYSKTPNQYYKFFLDPDKMRTGSDDIRIYNKVGLSNGFISDVSFIVDSTNGLYYFISGSMLAKKDATVDFGKNEYYQFAIPVFRKIGGLIYDHVLRNRQN
jgi:hypothetical protein